jgi:hypothetical protein
MLDVVGSAIVIVGKIIKPQAGICEVEELSLVVVTGMKWVQHMVVPVPGFLKFGMG